MGDTRRFSLMADLIARNINTRALRIADVAGGKGYLQSELRRRGFENVLTFDSCKGTPIHRPFNYRRQLFLHTIEEKFDAIVAMHPDGGTDHAILYASKHKIPFFVCPCCIIPSATKFSGPSNSHSWINHLIRLAERYKVDVQEIQLKMQGCNMVLMGKA
jgi:hypothetical protein